ncbi:sigma-70 family RNA polymerase sigma factor [Nocardioides sp. dk4132]|uniref:SigE family RNA polymerase sigma factor n=1 Tax=unclassified Nocardioides TaxID=2615069 RepID=UPI001295A387|nr:MULTISPECIES: SigE family RNA polymerase sigma factor [unclassified Nocardioides]MQW77485.1 sigma-70 family RNA polymerase sigma factor [Nocardioides sp. dk4132]QGA09284.1 sigma-70 family RNA polymerase sigma factor [Nocardioides sp. dk884]
MDGFEEFVEAETPRLLGLAHALTGNPHDAWDLVQEALVRVGVRWRRLADQNPGGYARTTLVRLRVDRARRLCRELLPGLLPERAAPVVIVEELDPWLLTALAGLSPHQRAAVVLRVLEDLEHAEIAARLRCSEGTARSHLSRGLARLREAAEERMEVE